MFARQAIANIDACKGICCVISTELTELTAIGIHIICHKQPNADRRRWTSFITAICHRNWEQAVTYVDKPGSIC